MHNYYWQANPSQLRPLCFSARVHSQSFRQCDHCRQLVDCMARVTARNVGLNELPPLHLFFTSVDGRIAGHDSPSCNGICALPRGRVRVSASIFICAFPCSHQLALWRLVEQAFKLRSAIFHFKFTSASTVLAIASASFRP